jgi:Arc/MetJ-type ribon-helix-helix transcriptional regulator
MAHVKGDTIRVYLPAEYVKRLELLKKTGQIKNVSAFVRQKLDEVASKPDPNEELKKIAEERKRLDEQEKVWLQCVHTKSARFDRLLAFLEVYKKYMMITKAPEIVFDWLDHNEVVKEIFGELDITDCAKALDTLKAIPNLTQSEAEKIMGGSL